MESGTIRALADITDEGLFEKIATAVLRLLPDYTALTHPGLNASGKTRKSPVDGLCFTGETREHLIVAHHTITAARALRQKWLHDPATIRRRETTKSLSTPSGDVIKTLEIVRQERKRVPSLTATLILATNQEPDEALIRDTVAAARTEQVAIDIWTCSRIAHVLDVDPVGQIVRRKLLGLEEDLLSRELLGELAVTSISAFDAGDIPEARVGRALDDRLSAALSPVTFLVAESGTGKTVACHKALEAHVAAGGAALVIPHAVIEQSSTLEQAAMAALIQLKPSLAAGQSPFAFVAEEDPLLILIEDVSRSNQPQRLIEKIASWLPKGDESNGRPPWCVLCPVWPHLFGGVASQVGNRIAALVLRPDAMSLSEAAAAVVTNARQANITIDADRARAIAAALGQDPLLIALNRNWSDPRPELVIERFVEDALARAQSTSNFLASEFREGLIELGAGLLSHRIFEPSWSEVLRWGLSAETIAAVKEVARHREILRIDGPSSDMRLRFRHDRIRSWVLTEAAAALDRNGQLCDAIVAEPLVAETLAAVLVRGDALPRLVTRVERQNPLALFHALRLSRPHDPAAERLADAAKAWLEKVENQGRATSDLRWQALAVLQDVEGEFMTSLLALFPREWATGMIARMRNGDIEGGIELCAAFDLQTAVVWLKQPIVAAQAKVSAKLTERLIELIDGDDDSVKDRRAALLRFAGVWGDPKLAAALVRLWLRDARRGDRLDVYLWALSRSATKETAAALLSPICAAWGALPEERVDRKPSSKDELVAHSVIWAFWRAVPIGALEYLIARADQPDLAWQIEYLLHGVDNPEVLLFQARCMAARRRRSVDSYFVNAPARRHWQRTVEGYGEAMSEESRASLKALWREKNADVQLRIAAFDLWSEGRQRADILILRSVDIDELRERSLRQRLERGDQTAIPALIIHLDSEDGMRWWHYARYVWSSALYEALDRSLARQAAKSVQSENEQYDMGSTLTRVILRLPILGAERLLLRYWEKLGNSTHFVQAALYFATVELRTKADEVISRAEEPTKLFEHLSIIYGVSTSSEPGITREVQLLALEPYLDLVDDSDLNRLADVCNDNGWYATRRRLLDTRIGKAPADTPDHMRSIFSDCVERGHLGFIDHEIDDMLKAGANWPEIASVLRDWLSAQTSPKALELAAQVLKHSGRRDDVHLLETWSGRDEQFHNEVIADTRFAVHRQRG